MLFTPFKDSVKVGVASCTGCDCGRFWEGEDLKDREVFRAVSSVSQIYTGEIIEREKKLRWRDDHFLNVK